MKKKNIINININYIFFFKINLLKYIILYLIIFYNYNI